MSGGKRDGAQRKNTAKWTRLSCRSFVANAVRLQLQAPAYNLANFLHTRALPDGIETWALTSLRKKLVKIGAKVVRHVRYVIFQMAKVADRGGRDQKTTLSRFPVVANETTLPSQIAGSTGYLGNVGLIKCPQTCGQHWRT